MKPHGYSRKERISRYKEVQAVKLKGVSRRSGMLRIWIRMNDLGFRRLAIQVSRRNGGAVARNRWKRLIRESFRLNKDRLPPSSDIIVAPQGPPLKLSMQDVAQELLALAVPCRGRT